MFLLLGVKNMTFEEDYDKKLVCPHCGRTVKPRIFMTATALRVFFIPTVKWNKRYYAEVPCCHSLYLLNPQVGRQIDYWGHEPKLDKTDLVRMAGPDERQKRVCRRCGFSTTEDFIYCPMCAKKLSDDLVVISDS